MRVAIVASWLLLLLGGCDQGSSCDLVQVAQISLEPRGRLFAVPVTLNGHAIRMLLDTGSQKSLVSETTAQRIGIVRDARFYTAISGMAGGSAKPDATVDSMSIGGVALSVDRMPVNTFSDKLGIDGVLGLDMLRDYDLDINGPKRELTLYRIRRCEHAEPPWNEAATPVTEISTQMGWVQIPFEVNNVAGKAFVDTGASYTLIMPRMARRLGLTDEAMANDRTLNLHVIAGDDAKTRMHRFDTVRVGLTTVHNVSLPVLAKEPPSLGDARHFGDGVIGQDFLNSRRVWFSFRTGRLYISRKDGDAGQ